MAGYSVTYTVVDNATRQIDQINRRIAAMRAPIDRMQRSMARFIDVSGLKKVADGFQWIARGAATALRSLTAIVPVLGALTAAGTIAGMTRLVSSFAQWGNQLRTNADQIGITTDQLQLFQNATTRAGGNVNDMTETLKNLHQISADAFTGMNNDAKAMFRQLGIGLTDSNGKLKTSTELLPEVFHALDRLQDPADRARVASTLLGDAQNKLYEEYKQGHITLDEAIRQEEAHKRLTDEQLESYNKYRLAIAGLETDFTQLGRQVGAILAEHMAPLLKSFDAFVQKYTPDIIKAVDDIAKRFDAWISGIQWKDVEENLAKVKQIFDDIWQVLKHIKEVWDGLAWAGRQLDEINKTVTESGQNTHNWIMRQLHGMGIGNLPSNPAPGLAIPGSSYQAPPAAANQNQQGGSWWSRHAPSFLGGNPSGTPRPMQLGNTSGAQPSAPVNMAAQQENLRRAMDEQGVTDPAMRAGIAAIASGEGGFRPRSEQGYGETVMKPHRGMSGPAYVRSIFGARVSDLNDTQLIALAQDDEAFFNKVYGGRLGNEYNEGYKYRGRGDFQLTGKGNYDRYGKMIGVDLVNNPDMVNDPEVSAKIAVAYMKDRYHGGGFEGMKRAVGNPVEATEAVKNANYQQYMASGEFARPAAAPESMPPPMNGSVTVDINHRNAPQGVDVAASGTGAVNVNAPKTVMPQLDFAAA